MLNVLHFTYHTVHIILLCISELIILVIEIAQESRNE